MLKPNNEIVVVNPSGLLKPRDYISMSPDPEAVCNHLVIAGIWMFYNVHEEYEEAAAVNHCASVLWNFRDPAAKTRIVHGPVLFTGSITGSGLSDDSITRLTLLARLAQTETKKLKEVK